MKALLAATTLSLAVAVTAAAFAIWPVVAEARWEEDTAIIADSLSPSERLRATEEARHDEFCQDLLEIMEVYPEAGGVWLRANEEFIPDCLPW